MTLDDPNRGFILGLARREGAAHNSHGTIMLAAQQIIRRVDVQVKDFHFVEPYSDPG